MAVIISFSTLSVAEVHPCTHDQETGLHSGERMVGFGMVSDLFINLAFKDFRKAGQDGYSTPIPVPFAEYQSVSDVFPRENWLLCCPS